VPNKTPVLILGYLRHKKLNNLLAGELLKDRRLYIFIDRAPEDLVAENTQTFETASSFTNRHEIKIEWSNTRLGVGKAIPAAVDWAFETEDSIIVLEDDCLPNEYALEFFDYQISETLGDNRISLISGTSPTAFNPNYQMFENSLSSFPLIWGWATNKREWMMISRLTRESLTLKEIVKFIISTQNWGAKLFFLAAYVRIKKKNLQAWDALVALELLRISKFALIPSVGVISNTGNDLQKSHDQINQQSEEVVKSSSRIPIHVNNFSSQKRRETDREILRNILKYKKRHIFSPIKAILNR
jgi:hypothetical protein